MKFLRVIHSLAPSVGGPVEGIMQSSRILEDLGHSVELACFDPPTELHIQTCPFPVTTFPSIVPSYGWSWDYVTWLQKKAQAVDVVLIHGLWLFPTLGTFLALRKSTCPYFIFSHGMLDPWFNKKYPAKFLKKLLYWLAIEKWALQSAQAVFFTCDEELKLAKTAFPFSNYRGQVIPYGTTRPKDDFYVCAEKFKATFPECRNTRNIIFVGRIHPKKGCDILLQAFAKVYGNNPDVRLVMVGPDSVGWKAQLKKSSVDLNIERQITWTGLLKGDMKTGAYASSEVFILPSHQENFGIVVAEALACGLAVLLSDQVNICNVIYQDGAGFVENDTTEGCTKLLQRWQGLTPTQKEQMAQAAKACFNRHYNLETSMWTLMELIKIRLKQPSHGS